MGMCFNKRVLIGLGLVALVLFALSPRLLGSAAPLLVMAACPISMIVMMRAMHRDEDRPTASDAQDGAAPDDAARLRELEEEVNRLKAETQLRSQQPST